MRINEIVWNGGPGLQDLMIHGIGPTKALWVLNQTSWYTSRIRPWRRLLTHAITRSYLPIHHFWRSGQPSDWDNLYE